MDSMLFMDYDFMLFKNFFGSKEEEEKIDKEPKTKANKKNDNQKSENKNEIKENNSQKKSNSESKKENTIKKIKKEEYDNLINQVIINKKEEKKEENTINENVIFDEKKAKKKELNKKQKENEKIERNKKKEELLSFLVTYIKKVYLYKKAVKKLIQRQKENYAIISSINSADLSMEIFLSEEKTQKVKYTYEPILKQNIFYIPKKLLKKKNLLKFSFLNKKKESIIDPKFNTEYDCGEFINVLNLKKIKDKEEEREEEFQSFLESYYTLRQSMSKQTPEINKYQLEKIRIKKKHKTVDNHKGGLVFGVGKIPSNSILKQRGEHRKVTSNKKISFSDKNETLSYKKDE